MRQCSRSNIRLFRGRPERAQGMVTPSGENGFRPVYGNGEVPIYRLEPSLAGLSAP